MKSHRALKSLATVLKLFVALVVPFPIIWMVLTALKPQSEVVTWPPTIFPLHWDWSNLVKVEQAGPFLRRYFNSVFVALVTVAGNLVFGVPAADALRSRPKFRGRKTSCSSSSSAARMIPRRGNPGAALLALAEQVRLGQQRP